MAGTPSDRFSFNGWRNLVASGALVGMAVIGLHGALAGSPASVFAGISLAGACLLAGAFLGFLFGIPRSLQAEGTPPTSNDRLAVPEKEGNDSPRYRVNTNLEQISDWLTKILVGVGLTQLNGIPILFERAGQQFGSSFAEGPTGTILINSIIIYFSILGFMGGYLWTRLFLGSALARADLETLNQRFDEIEEAQRQTQIDAKALSMVSAFLAGDATNTDIPALKRAIGAASQSIKVQAFYQAREARRKGGPNLKWTVPIFQALAENDLGQRYHKNFGQLGYALMEMSPADNKGAIEAFTKAIEIRGNLQQNGFPAYEFFRAACRIKSDPDYQLRQPSNTALANALRIELNAATAIQPELKSSDVEKWMVLNP